MFDREDESFAGSACACGCGCVGICGFLAFFSWVYAVTVWKAMEDDPEIDNTGAIVITLFLGTGLIICEAICATACYVAFCQRAMLPLTEGCIESVKETLEARRERRIEEQELERKQAIADAMPEVTAAADVLGVINSDSESEAEDDHEASLSSPALR